MKQFDKEKEWKFIISQTHGESPNSTNLMRRELLFIMQILLTKISEPQKDKIGIFLKKIYLKTKKQYLVNKTKTITK